jgi:hypothetical protein
MRKLIQPIAVILSFFFIISSGYTQESKNENLESLISEAEGFGIKRLDIERFYGTDKVDKMYEPLPTVLKLSYENFKYIKLLHTAIMNFGGGEDEFDKLVDEYAEASALYFRQNYIESAVKFMINERKIYKLAMKIAKKYQEETNKINNEVIKLRTKTAFKMVLSKKNITIHQGVDSAISDGAYTLAKGNDKILSYRPVDAILLYRRAKERFFNVYAVIEYQYKTMAGKAQSRSDMRYFDKESERYFLPERYSRDVADNQNRIYDSSNSEKREKDK